MVPVGDQSISESKRGSGICSSLIAVEHGAGQGGLNMADDFFLEFFFGGEGLGADGLPGLALGFGDGCCEVGY